MFSISICYCLHVQAHLVVNISISCYDAAIKADIKLISVNRE